MAVIIHDGVYVDENAIYPRMKNDYMYSKLTTKEIREKYGLSFNMYNKLLKRIKKETGFSRRSKYPKCYHYVKSMNKFRVIYKRKHYGYFDTEDEAKEAVEYMKSVDFDLDKFREKYPVKNQLFYYFKKDCNKYMIRYKREFYCYCDTEDEAKETVALLKKLNWDKEKFKEVRGK